MLEKKWKERKKYEGRGCFNIIDVLLRNKQEKNIKIIRKILNKCMCLRDYFYKKILSFLMFLVLYYKILN